MVTEWSCDYALLDERHGELEFVSVKHKEGSQAPWTLAQLLREHVLADLYRVWIGMGRRGRLTFETNAGVAPELAAFVREPANERWHSELRRVAGGLDVSNSDLLAFLAVFTVVEELPRRKEITDTAVRELAAVLDRWDLDSRAADECYTHLVSRIAQAATDRPPSPQERLSRLEGFTAAVLDRIAGQGQADRTITLDEARALVRARAADSRRSRAQLPNGETATPRTSRTFIGRQREVDAVAAALRGQTTDTLPALVVVTGPPGIGKTSLAIHAARAARAAFTDGHLFLAASGYTDAGQIVDALLEALEVDTTPMVRSPRQRVARLRHLLAGMSLIVILDGVTTERCVGELAGLGLHAAVICTSRARFSGLAELDPVVVEVAALAPTDAAELAAGGAGPQRLTPQQCAALSDACAGSPLAIRIAAARLARRPKLDADEYLLMLSDPNTSMSALSVGERSMATVIDDSYQSLTVPQRDVLHVLGMLPPAAITTMVVVAAIAQDTSKISPSLVASIKQCLDELFEANLVEQVDGERWRLHDVIHAFARSRTHTATGTYWRSAAMVAACRMYVVLTRQAWELVGFTDGARQVVASTSASAITQLDADRPAAVQATLMAADAGLWEQAVAMAGALTEFLYLRSCWAGLEAVYLRVRAAAEATGNRDWMTAALYNLAQAAEKTGRTPEAAKLYHESTVCARDNGDGQAMATAMLANGKLALQCGQARAALALITPTLRIWRAIDDNEMLVQALHYIGRALLATGQVARARMYLTNAARLAGTRRTSGVPQALVELEDAVDDAEPEAMAARRLATYRAIGDRTSEAFALLRLGLAQERTDRSPARALDTYRQALDLWRELGEVAYQANALYHLGVSARHTGDPQLAVDSLTECSELAERIGNHLQAASAMNVLADMHVEVGRHEEAEQWRTAAEEHASSTANPDLLAHIERGKARHLLIQGRNAAAVETFNTAVSLLGATGPSDSLSLCRVEFAEAMVMAGRTAEAATVLRDVLTERTSHVTDRTRAFALRIFARLYLGRGLLAEAHDAVDKALTLARTCADQIEQLKCRTVRANLLAGQERHQEAINEFNEALALANELKQIQLMVAIRANRAGSYRALGDTEVAEGEITELLGMCQRLQLHGMQASLHNTLGAIRADEGKHDQAGDQFAKARDIAQRLNDQPTAASTAMNQAKALLHTRPDLAAEAAAESIATFSAMQDWRAAAQAFLIHAYARAATDPSADLNGHLARLARGIPNALAAAVYQILGDGASRTATGIGNSEGRVIAVSDEVGTGMGGLDLDSLLAIFTESRQHCFICNLPITETGAANLVRIITTAQPGAHWFRLVHADCGPSQVVDLGNDHPTDETSLEFECCFFAGAHVAVIVDCHGGWHVRSDGTVADGILNHLRTCGFVEGKAYVQAVLDRLPVPPSKLTAQLVGAELRLHLGSQQLLAAPLMFIPAWYEALRGGQLDVVFGRALEGLSWQDGTSLHRAIERSRVVAARLPIAVVPPRRDGPCVCERREQAKYKQCCGVVGSRRAVAAATAADG
ncbi:ATP-binding protein [Salinispora arenicola]|uniref:tetratricopeptide repeat protein n=1 Tax=Salinispora arenicola TaxID=168697 RepID=UPI00048326F5|nr:ATP-binding protein [Salinispora arenicola]